MKPVITEKVSARDGVGLATDVCPTEPDIAKLSWSDPKPLVCGEPTRLRLQMNNVAYTFPAGSRIALLIASSCCPRILPHRNTMAPTWTETRARKAKQELLHARGIESCLCLPVIET